GEKGLATYLEDHLAGATGAIDLLKNLEEEHTGQPLARVLEELRGEIQSDRATLAALSERVGRGEHSVKETAARLGEKLSRWKLERSVSGPIGTLEALEALALGIWGKRALWLALRAAGPRDAGIETADLGRLIHRAETQHERVEQLRLEAAREAFGAPVAASPGRAS
ncbi:MAG: hypothetical protein ACM3NW_08935, partial [Syntrophomonadaceae bacterium]